MQSAIDKKSIHACIDNSERLLDETYDIEFRSPLSTSFFLAVIAQEELAKAFILFLVEKDVMPWNLSVKRAIQDHVCKQLMCMIMDWVIREWETLDDLKREIKKDLELGNLLPNDVGSALNIFALEKVGRWTNNNLVLAEDRIYDPVAKKIAKGKTDQKKQKSLYVGIGADGRVSSTPNDIDKSDVAQELERARRLLLFVKAIMKSDTSGCFDQCRYNKVVVALTNIFESE
ncbi:MAG: AbiV family abortive infection protein [Alphaproteobacteria bacterium]